MHRYICADDSLISRLLTDIFRAFTQTMKICFCKHHSCVAAKPKGLQKTPQVASELGVCHSSGGDKASLP